MTDEHPDIDARLRAWGENHRDTAPAATVPAFRATASRRWTSIAIAAVAVAAVAGLAVAVRPGGVHAPATTPTASDNNPASTSTGTPAGLRQSVFHGLALDVPVSWFSGTVRCGVPKTNVIEVPPGDVATCSTGRPAGITSVEWLRWDSKRGLGYLRPLRDPHTTQATVDGHETTRIDGVLGDLHVTRLTVPDLFAGVEIETPDAATADRILATLKVVRGTADGCSAQTSIVTLADAPRPTRDRADEQLIPDVPSNIVICHYVNGYLEQSDVVPDNGRPIAETVNRLPAGVSIAKPGTYIPSECGPNTVALGGSVDADTEIYVLHVNYQQGPALELVARNGLCGDLGISNGARTGQRTDALFQALVRAAGTSGTIPSVIAKP